MQFQAPWKGQGLGRGLRPAKDADQPNDKGCFHNYLACISFFRGPTPKQDASLYALFIPSGSCIFPCATFRSTSWHLTIHFQCFQHLQSYFECIEVSKWGPIAQMKWRKQWPGSSQSLPCCTQGRSRDRSESGYSAGEVREAIDGSHAQAIKGLMLDGHLR